LVIPRGSSELVASIKTQSKMIPVLGHAEGICHVYVDKDANPEEAVNIVLDSKTDYPAACNAMETLLIHEECMKNGLFDDLVKKLKSAGVKLYSGPNLSANLAFSPELASNLKHEYGDLECTIELVKSVYEAIDHIHKFGSSHTDSIVSEDETTVQTFLECVDSACVFANCSTRMADGYRLGLGKDEGCC